MEISDRLKSGFHVGDWVIDPQGGNFIRNGHPQHVEPKVMDVLLVLASNPGEVVSRDELMDQVWSDVVVTDDVLTRCISELRNLLGDTGKLRTYIKTVPKRGYSLIMPVQAMNAAPEAKTSIAPTAPVTTFDKASLPTLLRWALPIGALALFGLAIFRSEPSTPVPPATTIISNNTSPETSDAPLEIKSMVVLPFANLSNDSENEFFSDGLSEDIRNALINTTDIRVAARTSSIAFKNRAMDVRKIAQQLNVDALLEGTVRLIDDRLRVTAQLTSGSDGYPVWSESYERPINDKLDLQVEIAREIVARLAPSLQGQTDLVKAATTNAKAQEYYLLGRHHWHLRTRESVATALEHFQQAQTLDPSYAPAYSGLADSHVFSTMYGDQAYESAMEQARANALTALELDPTLAEAHASMGMIFETEDKLIQARDSYLKSVELKPQYSMGHMWLGNTYSALREANQALQHHQIASVLDPLHPQVQLNYVGALMSVGNYQAAELIIDNITQPDNQLKLLKTKLSLLLQTGQYDRLLRAALRNTPGDEFAPYNSHNVVHALIHMQRFDEARQLINDTDIDFHPLSKKSMASALAIATRDASALRAAVAVSTDHETSTKPKEEYCTNIVDASYHQLADFMERNHSAVLERAYTMDNLFQERDNCASLPPSARLGSINIAIASSLALGENASERFALANDLLDDLKTKGWGNSFLAVEELSLRMLEGDYEAAETLLVEMQNKGWQPFGMIRFKPLFDQFVNDKASIKLLANAQSQYHQLVKNSQTIKLAKLGL